jgi:hypothetical protein
MVSVIVPVFGSAPLTLKMLMADGGLFVVNSAAITFVLVSGQLTVTQR